MSFRDVGSPCFPRRGQPLIPHCTDERRPGAKFVPCRVAVLDRDRVSDIAYTLIHRLARGSLSQHL